MGKNKKPQLKSKGKPEVVIAHVKETKITTKKGNLKSVSKKGKTQVVEEVVESEDEEDEEDLAFIENDLEEDEEDLSYEEGEEDDDDNELPFDEDKNKDEDEIEEEEADEEEVEPKLIALEDLQNYSDDDENSEPLIDEDAIPIQKISVNDKEGLERVLNKIKNKNISWIETQVIEEKQAIEIKDVYDDLQRELAFYQQGLSSAIDAKKRFKQLNIPFERPDDYFAEMVKSDEHMMKIRQKILDETQGIKASETARKQRELKKFGKQVQVEKLKERHLHKKQELEKIKSFKRKLKDNDANEDDFDIELDNEPEPKKFTKGGSKISRDKRDKKYGFGGKKRHTKSNDKKSTHADEDGFNLRKNKQPFNSKGGKSSGPKKRPGKAKRQQNAGN